jgi:3-oxoacyl-[acyl-carrier-protein] synthase-3
MATIIKASCALPNGPQSSIGMSALAAKQCLAIAGVAATDVDLLLNIGVFRDDNIIEPAMAPLIQQQLGMNLDPVRHHHLHRSTLSFDINDGECGFLTAASIADSFFRSGQAQYALVVSGDIHPSKTDHPEFPFKSVACAVLLARIDDDRRGFSGFHFKTSAAGGFGFSASVDLLANGLKSRKCMTFSVDDGYIRDLMVFASSLLGDVFSAGRIDPQAVDYIVASQPAKGFGKVVARASGVNGGSQIIDLFDEYGDAHTSCLGLGYHHLAGGGQMKANDRVLFIAAGSGLSAACAQYVV